MENKQSPEEHDNLRKHRIKVIQEAEKTSGKDYKPIGLRKRMVEELREGGFKNEVILEVINKIPRHLFIGDTAFLKIAYSCNEAFGIGAGQTISRPHTVAVQSDLLNIQKGDKVLEIGTGSGYQTSVLCELGAVVFSIERQKELYLKTGPLLKGLGYKPYLFYGDGYKGLPENAPFDKIIVTCGAPFIPQDLLKQLKVGGLMVIPVDSADGKQQDMLVLKKIKENEFEKKISKGTFRFVPMLTEKN